MADSLNRDCSGAYKCISGGTVLAVFFSVIIGSMSLGQIAPPLTDLFAAKAAARPLLDVIRRAPLIDGLSDAGLKPEVKPSGKLDLKEVTFAYPSRPDALVCRGMDLTIMPGEVVAIVGPSGSGKACLCTNYSQFCS